MTVGLPAAGISALFYLLCVLFMPIQTAWSITTRQPLRPGHWRLLATQSAISLGIVASLVLTGWTLAQLLPGPPGDSADGSGATTSSVGATIGILSGAGFLLALTTLVAVMLFVQVLAWRAARRSRPAAAPTRTGAGHITERAGGAES